MTFDGEFFWLQDALIVPAPSPRIPMIVGGRSDAAVGRAARLGDGWLGIWVSPRRFASARDQITREATPAGRDASRTEHALNVWCGFAPTREAARERLAAQMQAFYQMPFEPFESYSPYGTPEHVAEFLTPYIDAGCSAFNVIPCAGDDESAIAAVGELRTLLTAGRMSRGGAHAGRAVGAGVGRGDRHQQTFPGSAGVWARWLHMRSARARNRGSGGRDATKAAAPGAPAHARARQR